MSESKFHMAKKLANVQNKLMGCEIQDMSLDTLLPLIFEKCREEKLMFWFNTFEEGIVLNLRDIETENYELNIRHYYTFKDGGLDEIKLQVLTNAFLLTSKEITLEDNEDSSALHKKEPTDVKEDEVIPSPIKDAIDTIKAKGVEVTKKGIRNHVPWDNLTTTVMEECTDYLQKMEVAS